jgi:hypothetical protein
MLKNSPLGFSKGIVPLLVALTLCISCTKSYDPGNLLSDKFALLTGQPDSVNWVLNVVRSNNTSDTSAKGAMKIYHADGTFTDNLGFTGYWTLYSRDSLIESTRSCVNPNAPYFTNHFHIDRLDKGRLQLTYSDIDKKIQLVYDSNK